MTPIDVKIGAAALADEFDAAPRYGSALDEPEGMRWIVLSDTKARDIAAWLRTLAE